MKLVAVICGNIRDIIDFKLTLTRLVELREEKKIERIIFSTWENELARYPELAETMRQGGIDVVETIPLQERYSGIASNSVNYWRQARQIQSALDVIEGDCFVIKTRTDRCLNFLNQIDWSNLNIEKTKTIGALSPVFEYKMSVFSPKMVRLFNLNDFIFVAYKRDIYKLINFDISELLLDRDIVANTQWFIYPFFKEYPILRDYFRLIHYRPLVPALREYVESHQLNSKFPMLFYKVHAIYCALLYMNFNIMPYDKKIIEKNIGQRHIYQIFSTLPSNEIIYSNIGSTIRSNRIIADLMESNFSESEAESDRVWHEVRQSFEKGAPSLTAHDYEELQLFFKEKLYGDVRWLRNIKNPPRISLDKEQTQVQKVDFFSQEEQHLKVLKNSAQFDKDLYRIWLSKNPRPEESDRYLLSYAKAGAMYPILHLIRCLRHGRISESLHAEVLRFSLYFPAIKDVRNNFNVHSLLIIVNRFLADSKSIEAKNLLIKYSKQFLNLDLPIDLQPKYLYRMAQEFFNQRERKPFPATVLMQQFILEISWNKSLYQFLKEKGVYVGEYMMLNDRYPI